MSGIDGLHVTDQELAAYHEAGHAVLACLTGVRFRLVTLASIMGSQGFVAFLSTDNPSPEYITVLFAGLLAEKRRLGADWVLERSLCKDDIGRAERLVASAPDAKRAMAARYARAEDEIRSPRTWAAVTAVAESLLARGVIYEDRVRELVNAAMIAEQELGT